jgi:hypothetical protein
MVILIHFNNKLIYVLITKYNNTRIYIYCLYEMYEKINLVYGVISKIMLESSSSCGSRAQNRPWPPLLGFRYNNLLTGLDWTRPPYLRLPETWWPSYTLRRWVHILVAYYDMRGLQWDYSLIPVTTRNNVRIRGDKKRKPMKKLF